MTAELRQIRYFAAVARHGSFAAAAASLHVSQPAVGQQVRNLEDRLAVSLLDRHARGVRLTPAGQVFLHHAEQILRRVADAERSVLPFRRARPRKIVIGATPSAGRALAPYIMAACSDQAQLALSIRHVLTEEALRLLEQGELDIALCYGAAATAARVAPLYQEPFCLIGPPGALPRPQGEIAFRDLADHKLILDPVVRQLVERSARSLGVQLHVLAEVEPASVTLELLAGAGCCSILARGLFLDDVVAGRACCLAIREPSVLRTLYFNAAAEAPPGDVDLLIGLLGPAVKAEIARGDLGWRDPPAISPSAFPS